VHGGRAGPVLALIAGNHGYEYAPIIARIEWGVMNVMRHLKILDGQAQMVESPLFIDRNEVLRSTVTGIFYPLVERGHTVAEGTLLGYVTDFFGKRLLDLRAPFSGEVLYILGTPPANQGEPLAMIGHLGETQR
jgi:hypothetical protein